MTRAVFAVFAVLAMCALAGCERAKQDMYDQPKYKPFGASTLFEDGTSARTAPDGTQPRARGAFAESSGGRRGTEAVSTDIAAERAQANPYPVDLALLRRGQERYTIYCMPCHSPAGDGDGLVVRRGFPPPPTYHQDRLRTAPDRHIYDVIKNGYGVMVAYGDRVEPADRWAIVAYVRALQLSQDAKAAALPPDMRAKLALAEQGRPQLQPEPGAVAQPNRRDAAPPEKLALPPPPSSSSGTDASQAQAGLPQLVPQGWPGKAAPVLSAPLERQLKPVPDNHPGSTTGLEDTP